MASVTISLRTDSDLKKQAEEILNQLGLTLNGTINMLLHQIVREQSVPLSMSISSQNSLYSDLLLAEDERKNGLFVDFCDFVNFCINKIWLQKRKKAHLCCR